MRVELNRLKPEEFIILFHSVGWDPPEVDQVAIALDNSICTFSLYEGSELIGMARILGDKAMSFYIKDFVILPEKQNKGNGKLLMNTIIATIKNKLSNGYKVSIELISSKGKEEFYEKFGFEKRPCDYDGAGMFMMI
ncbi:GNAT family N-acetyltransferase [Sedimentibacter sp.]|uniref:GNAT family N-acetyltransferase n=1 Tax=Sedimentibacter sp. TaxID=1960295 RepID=UPI0028AEC65F|nr:GNAT family N-acetyltransferase [Sedimentibacter sp.]